MCGGVHLGEVEGLVSVEIGHKITFCAFVPLLSSF